MFCSKCGAKVTEDAAFCEKCGTRLTQNSMEAHPTVAFPAQESEEISVVSATATSKPGWKTVKDRETKITQEADIHEEASSISEGDADIYAILKENIGICPAIKSAKQVKKGVRLCGKVYSYFVKFVKEHTDQVRMKSMLAFPFSILYWVLGGLLCCIIGMLLTDFMKYGSNCIEYNHGILFAICCLVAGAAAFTHSFAGHKEKAAVADYVRDVAKRKNIYLFHGKRAAMPKIRIVAAAVLVLAGIIIISFNLPNLVNSLKYHDELLYNGLPVTRFLEMTQEDVESEYGEPWFTGQHIITGDDYHDYSCNNGSISDVVYSKKTGKVIYIRFYGDRCSCNGKRLNKSLERVLDILSVRYKGGYPLLGIYGSKHSGFYYEEAVYFGETPSQEEILAQMEFENGRYDNYDFVSLNVRGKQDYKIDLISQVWMDAVQNIGYVCLYTDEWIDTLNASVENISLSDTVGNNSNEPVQENDYALLEEFISLYIDPPDLKGDELTEYFNCEFDIWRCGEGYTNITINSNGHLVIPDHTAEYAGTWWDIYSQRCNMEISSYDGIYYNIEINWGCSAWENTHWSFFGTYDEIAGGIHYYGSRIEESYLGNGEMQETYVYSDGEGLIWVGDDGMLYWDDYVEQQGADCSFEKNIE